MLFDCPFCGKTTLAHWPELWPYRYHSKLFCSENCVLCEVTLTKLGKGKKKKMERMKKDGTPAKKPGRKPTIKLDGELKIETPEAHNVDIVETPEAPNVVNKPGQPATCDGFTVRAIEGEYGRYFRDQIGDKDYIDYTSIGGEELSMTVDNWIKFVAELDRAFTALGVEL